MQQSVSQIIIAAPISRTVEFEHDGESLLNYMGRSFPDIEFMLDLHSCLRQQEAFGLIPIAGEAGDGARGMFKPLDASTMAEMYEALQSYGGKPSLN